ncbi:MAG: hypothetical protein R6U67_12035, partial [Sodalinema sp.]|uniref:hypothetical protein n=1 Tax=Sodalinema sp. TaxID=3080550 RepID=UPI00396F52AF
ALKDELSVRWLLWLGLFVVLVSSAVLAASQWGRFPAAGQYGILWIYTVGFAAASSWLHRRQRLALTAQTLETIVLGLIPLNFWAMDEFALWRSPLGWATMLLASLSLSFWLWRGAHLPRRQTALLLLFSLSHWAVTPLPLLAQFGVYLATLAGVLADRQRADLPLLGLVGYGLASFSGRELLNDPMLLSNWGLAWGLLGWQLAEPKPGLRSRLGAILLTLGWGLSLPNLSWAAIAVTVLALHRLSQRLQHLGKPRDLLLTALVGLQGYIILGQLLPESFRNAVWQQAQALLGPHVQIPFLSFLFLPYLLAHLALSQWLYRQTPRRSLARKADTGAFFVGLVLAAIATHSFPQTWLVWIPLAGLLAAVTQHRYRQSTLLATLSQLLLLGGIASILDWQIDGYFSQTDWGLISLSFALLQGSWTNRQQMGIWQTSSWSLSLGLGAASYVLLVLAFPSETLFHPGWYWWLMPLFLAIAAHVGVSHYRTQAGWLAILGAIALQPLPDLITSSDPRPGLILSSGLGLLIALATVRSLRDTRAGIIAVGFAVYWAIAVSAHLVPLWGQDWLLFFSCFPLGLWSVRRWGQQRGGDLSRLYLRGCQVWGWVTWVAIIIGFTLRSVLSYQNAFLAPSLGIIAGLGLLILSLGVHQGRRLNTWGLYGIGWAVELIAVETVFLFTYSLWIVALVNIALGLLVQGVSQLWQPPQVPRHRLSPLHTLPMAYGLIALILRGSLIHPWTGVVSVGVSLILLNVGRQLPSWGRGLVYVGVVALSLSSSELLLGQLSQVSEGDRGVAVALVMVVWMSLYRGLYRPLGRYLQLPPQRLMQIAHGHWGVGTLMLSLSATVAISQPALALMAGGLLTRYALWQSRSLERSRSSRLWLYLGVAQGSGVVTIAVAIAGQQGLILPWFGAIAVLLSLGIRQAPWSAWGWHPQPWQQLARVFPAIVGVLTLNDVHPLSLLAISLFYIALGQWDRQVRWHYLALTALCGLASQGLNAFDIDALILWLAPVTLSILYVAQVDPSFRDGGDRTLRHQLRLGTLALFFALSYLPSHWPIIGSLSLLLLLAGLSLKIRAFLFVGTAFFVITILEQFIILGTLYTLSKWILGLGFGLVLILAGAIFESKKLQIKSTLNSAAEQLKDWE